MSTQTINLSRLDYTYSISGDVGTFLEYEHIALQVTKLFGGQSTGLATIFRSHRYAPAQTEAEEVTITLFQHAEQLSEFLLSERAHCEELESERDDIQEELDDWLNTDSSPLTTSTNNNLLNDLHYKVTTLGYSSKEVLDEIFRDNELAGRVSV